MPEKTLRDCGVQQYGYPIFKLLVEVYPQKFFSCAAKWRAAPGTARSFPVRIPAVCTVMAGASYNGCSTFLNDGTLGRNG